ncbi:hypothetical protein [Nocardia sp. NPDC052566]|uniref:hypothetical protein n=1 Tax=Nocardia sp. NPDC052566 TaxID=3364330 RepID=UPI0037C843DE
MNNSRKIEFDDLAQVLTWRTTEYDTLTALRAEYAESLRIAMGRFLDELTAIEPRSAEPLLTVLDSTGDDRLISILTTPATSCRLITRRYSREEVRAHLLAEITAPGARTRVGYLGVVIGRIPVFRDPDNAPMRPVAERIDRVFTGIATRSAAPVHYLPMVVRELWLRADRVRTGFLSNSPRGFVGRAVLTNPDLGIVDDVIVAEAVIHEATHGLLGMSEAVGLVAGTPWLRRAMPDDGRCRVVSPWTGRGLDLPTYLHACFVWWGLLHLWAGLLGTGLFDECRVRGRLRRAAAGFVDGAVAARLAECREVVDPALLRCLERMSERALGLLADMESSPYTDRAAQ